jgi:hypothetical protein
MFPSPLPNDIPLRSIKNCPHFHFSLIYFLRRKPHHFSFFRSLSFAIFLPPLRNSPTSKLERGSILLGILGFISHYFLRGQFLNIVVIVIDYLINVRFLILHLKDYLLKCNLNKKTRSKEYKIFPIEFNLGFDR